MCKHDNSIGRKARVYREIANIVAPNDFTIALCRNMQLTTINVQRAGIVQVECR